MYIDRWFGPVSVFVDNKNPLYSVYLRARGRAVGVFVTPWEWGFGVRRLLFGGLELHVGPFGLTLLSAAYVREVGV